MFLTKIVPCLFHQRKSTALDLNFFGCLFLGSSAQSQNLFMTKKCLKPTEIQQKKSYEIFQLVLFPMVCIIFEQVFPYRLKRIFIEIQLLFKNAFIVFMFVSQQFSEITVIAQRFVCIRCGHSYLVNQKFLNNQKTLLLKVPRNFLQV